MPQSLSKVIIHIISSTKDREPWLDHEIRSRMHAYLATVCRDMDGEAYRRGGGARDKWQPAPFGRALPRRIRPCAYRDDPPRTLSQADLIEHMKTTSSKWVKGLAPKYGGFHWQRGYADFSVSPSQLGSVLDYVSTQEDHHRTRTFQDEYREFLRKHEITFDERYVWD